MKKHCNSVLNCTLPLSPFYFTLHSSYFIVDIILSMLHCSHVIYLRNLLTHTVNNLLQTLNSVKSIHFLLLYKNSILFTSCVKISKQYLDYYAYLSLYNSLSNLKGSKLEVTKIGIYAQIYISVRQLLFLLSC